MLIADAATIEAAKAYIFLSMPIEADLKWRLGEVQTEALQKARKALDDEIREIGRIRGPAL